MSKHPRMLLCLPECSCIRERRSTMCVPCVDLTAYCTVGDYAWWCRESACSGTLHGRACARGACLGACERGKACLPCVDPTTCCTVGATSGGAGVGTLHACTLTRECLTIWALTTHCVYVRLLELARMTEIGSAAGCCSACVLASQSTWGAALAGRH